MLLLYALGGVVLLAITVVLLYLFSIGVGIIIPVNTKYRPIEDGVRIYISTNGIHTDFILPTRSAVYDWSAVLPSAPFGKSLDQYRYVAIGSGDRHFYLELDSWAELTINIAAKAMLVPTPMIMHVIGRDELPWDQTVREIKLTTDQYTALCGFIHDSFNLDAHQEVQLIPDVGYTEDDNFYLAHGVYHALHTCNYWVNKGLKRIGVRTPLWSPVAGGIFYQIEKVTGKSWPMEEAVVGG